MDDKEILLLIKKLQLNTISPEEIEKLRAFLHKTGGSKTMLRLLQEKYDEVSIPSDEIVLYENEEKIKERLIQRIQKEQPIVKKRHNQFYRVAGVAAIGLLIGFLFLTQKQKLHTQELEWTTVYTQHGERKKIKLNDGSTIELNGNTKLSYLKRNAMPVRLVKLEGEAFFNVIKDESKPFLVISEQFTTQVVGTSFNIDTDIAKTVEVNTGKVHVFAIDSMQTSQLLREKGVSRESIITGIGASARQKIVLPYGKKAYLEDTNQWKVSTYQHKNWIENELVFLNEPLHEVLRKAYRNYGDSIAVDPALANTNITITFKGKKKEQILNTLVEISNGKLTQDQKTRIWKITKRAN